MLDRDDEPGAYTIEEGRRILRIGRNVAYDEIKRTGALAGVPVLRIGRQYRLPGEKFRKVVRGEV
jgi:hypothetical protein